MTARENNKAVSKAALHFVQVKKRSGAANSSSAQGYMRGQSFGGNLNKLESVTKCDL